MVRIWFPGAASCAHVLVDRVQHLSHDSMHVFHRHIEIRPNRLVGSDEEPAVHSKDDCDSALGLRLKSNLFAFLLLCFGGHEGGADCNVGTTQAGHMVHAWAHIQWPFPAI